MLIQEQELVCIYVQLDLMEQMDYLYGHHGYKISIEHVLQDVLLIILFEIVQVDVYLNAHLINMLTPSYKFV